jgi:hypothetical protein
MQTYVLIVPGGLGRMLLGNSCSIRKSLQITRDQFLCVTVADNLHEVDLTLSRDSVFPGEAYRRILTRLSPTVLNST